MEQDNNQYQQNNNQYQNQVNQQINNQQQVFNNHSNQQFNKKRRNMLIAGPLILLIVLVGITYAFFNYTRTGTANTISTGRVSFNADQAGTINLTNAFPITSEEAETDTDNAKSVTITVMGDTDYADGLEYLVTASDVNLTVNNKQLPVALEVSVSSNTSNTPATTLGTEETGDYYANRSSYTVSKYKILYDGELEEDARILAGYIAPNATQGTPSGVDGIITFKAYIDKDKILISDTYNNGNTPTDNLGTPSNLGEGKTVFTTNEWNSIQSSPLSFKVTVESNEGIWVKQPTAAQVISKLSSLEITPYGKVYSGATVDNYVIFNNEQWRILGVYTDSVNGNKLKIIRDTPLGTRKAFNENESDGNAWDGSDIQEYLTNEYYSTLSQTARNMIDEQGKWDVGATTYDVTASVAYANATTASSNTNDSNITYTTPWTGKIGLISTYEYQYAAENDGTCWTTNGDNYRGQTCAGKDWLYNVLSDNGIKALTITPFNLFPNRSLFVNTNVGYVDQYYVTNLFNVFPVVYLKPDVTITGGTGESGGNEYTLGYTAN